MKDSVTFQDQVLEPLLYSFQQYPMNNAFCINGIFYTYQRFGEIISSIQDSIRELPGHETHIGLVANDDIETYAAIIAIWLEGKCYVPVNPDAPAERNVNILNQAGVKVVVDSSAEPLYPGYYIIQSGKLTYNKTGLLPRDVPGSKLAYIFFTSGTTGIPKGVPITRTNIAGFINAFFDLDIRMGPADKCLQMFDLTFDLSVMSYLVPLLKGACVYTIPKNKIKFNYIAELLEEQHLTVALMVPSIIHYLRPYFVEINNTSLRYSLFCGEALPLDVTAEWAACIPEAKIMNVYGPTEDTIFCTHYTYNRNGNNKVSNGLLSIGQAMKETYTIIVDDNDEIVKPGKKGQLCLGGIQLTPGYWNNEEKNKEAFFTAVYKGTKTRFYKTGDLCLADEAGDIMYLGRIDSQVKVQGYRVELSEIEFYAKECLLKINVVALAFTNPIGNTEIALFIESDEFDTKALFNYLKAKIPAYMIPTRLRFKQTFPLNANGKIDRKKLQKKC